jgi:hypothetical protein
VKLFLLCLFVWTAILAAACTAPLEYPPGPCDRTFFVAPGFSPEERQAIDRAIDRWNAIAIDQYCAIDMGLPVDIHTIRRVEAGSPEYKRMSASLGGVQFYGVYFGGTFGSIVVVSGLPVGVFEAVMLHELGHAHGLDHTPAPSIMHVHQGTAYDFTHNDIAECKRVGACRL